jgi:hypothetical protein
MEWIKCKDRLPDKEGHYLIFTTLKLMYVASYEKSVFFAFMTNWVIVCECSKAEDCLLTQDMITHWRELPEEPINNTDTIGAAQL